MLATMVDAGHRVVAFEGPGQGGALEEHGLPMIAEWERRWPLCSTTTG